MSALAGVVDGSRLAGAAALAGVALLVWLVLGREGPQHTSLATIVGKARQDASAYVQMPVGDERSVSTPVEISMGEADVFELRVDGVAELVRASFNTVKGRGFEVGQRVRVRLARRGFPPL